MKLARGVGLAPCVTQACVDRVADQPHRIAGAAGNEILGCHSDEWKVRVEASAERVAGRASRCKLAEVVGMDAEEIGRRLEAAARSS